MINKDELVETVARALWEHEFSGEGKWPINVENPEDWYSQARAAIAALEASLPDYCGWVEGDDAPLAEPAPAATRSA